MNAEQIATLWNSVVKHGTTVVNVGSGRSYFKFYMSADRNECAHNIRENDPLYFSAVLDTTANTFKVTAAVIYTNPPTGSHLALGSQSMRCKTIKNVTPEKLAAYFNKVVNELIIPNLTNLSKYQAKLASIYTELDLGGV